VIGRCDPTPGLQGETSLEIVEQGTSKGMGVIPWFEFGFMAPADSDLAKRHDWLTSRRDGSQIWIEEARPSLAQSLSSRSAAVYPGFNSRNC